MINAKPGLVLVDDEERILRSLALLFRPHYNLFTTVDARAALDYLRHNRVHVVVSDQRMPVMRGADLLRQVREVSPSTMRILLTGYSELEAVVASVNEGEVFRFINKPWDASELRSTVQQAAEISLGLFAAAAATPVLDDAFGDVSPLMPGLLVVDDDAEVVKTVQQILSPLQPVYWASSLEQAFVLLAHHDIGVVISELFVQKQAIALALKMLKAQHPEVVTIVMTPFQDTNALIRLINEGQVYRFLPKPIRRGPLGVNIQSALRHHLALKNAPKLQTRYAVQTVGQPEDASLATRIVSYLSRLRGRNLLGTRASQGSI